MANRYPDIGIKGVCGVYSAQYSLSRNIKSIFPFGQNTYISQYSELPNITVTYSQYLDVAGSFNPLEFNSLTSIELVCGASSVVCDDAILNEISYTFNLNGPFLVTRTYIGYKKPTSKSGTQDCSTNKFRPLSRKDYTGSIPGGISSSALISVTATVSVDRQPILEFGSRKPYASVVNFPITSSIKFEAYTNDSDSYVFDNAQNACGDYTISGNTYSATACGKGITINNATLTEIGRAHV